MRLTVYLNAKNEKDVQDLIKKGYGASGPIKDSKSAVIKKALEHFADMVLRKGKPKQED